MRKYLGKSCFFSFAEAVGYLEQGNKVTVIFHDANKFNGWARVYYVKDGEAIEGWLNAKYLKFSSPSTESESESESVSVIYETVIDGFKNADWTTRFAPNNADTPHLAMTADRQESSRM